MRAQFLKDRLQQQPLPRGQGITVRPVWWYWWSPSAWRDARNMERLLSFLERERMGCSSASFESARAHALYHRVRRGRLLARIGAILARRRVI